MEIILKNILETNTYPDAGKVVFTLTKSAIESNDNITIDMTDVISVPTSFMNTSFGDLMNLFGVEKTKSTFIFKNIRRTQAERFQKYFTDYSTLKQLEEEKKEADNK